MEVSLQQAIEIHARVLKHRSGRHAPRKAREKAEALARAGDEEGHRVWLRVGEVAEALIREAEEA
jgi:predicted nucleic acid-binding protein